MAGPERERGRFKAAQREHEVWIDGETRRLLHGNAIARIGLGQAPLPHVAKGLLDKPHCPKLPMVRGGYRRFEFRLQPAAEVVDRPMKATQQVRVRRQRTRGGYCIASLPGVHVGSLLFGHRHRSGRLPPLSNRKRSSAADCRSLPLVVAATRPKEKRPK
jgi:hypothetical protein